MTELARVYYTRVILYSQRWNRETLVRVLHSRRLFLFSFFFRSHHDRLCFPVLFSIFSRFTNFFPSLSLSLSSFYSLEISYFCEACWQVKSTQCCSWNTSALECRSFECPLDVRCIEIIQSAEDETSFFYIFLKSV